MLWANVGGVTSPPTIGPYRFTFPMGVISEFSGDNAVDFFKNDLKVGFFTDAGVAINCHTKIWFTDN